MSRRRLSGAPIDMHHAEKLHTYTDDQLAAVLPTLTLKEQIEEVIRKYVGSVTRRHRNGKNSAARADAEIAAELVARLEYWGVLK